MSLQPGRLLTSHAAVPKKDKIQKQLISSGSLVKATGLAQRAFSHQGQETTARLPQRLEQANQ